MASRGLSPLLALFNREPQANATELRHTTLATARLRFLFVAAKIWRHAGRTGVSYSDQYEEKSTFQRLMDRLRRIAARQGLCTSHAAGPALKELPAVPSISAHRNLCIDGKSNEASNFDAGPGGTELSGGR